MARLASFESRLHTLESGFDNNNRIFIESISALDTMSAVLQRVHNDLMQGCPRTAIEDGLTVIDFRSYVIERAAVIGLCEVAAQQEKAEPKVLLSAGAVQETVIFGGDA